MNGDTLEIINLCFPDFVKGILSTISISTFISSPHLEYILSSNFFFSIIVNSSLTISLTVISPKDSWRTWNCFIPFIPSIMKADFYCDFDSLELPAEIKKAVILHHGKLTKNYQYINKYL